MLYVKDYQILTERQLLQVVGVMRAEPPRQQDLDDWGAYVLQPDNPPSGDIVIPLQTASEAEDSLWYRDYEVRDFDDATVLARAKQDRDAMRYAPIEVNGMLFDANALSQTNITEAINNWELLTQVRGTSTLAWTLADDTEAEVTQNDLIAVSQAITLRVAQLHANYKSLKETLAHKEDADVGSDT